MSLYQFAESPTKPQMRLKSAKPLKCQKSGGKFRTQHFVLRVEEKRRNSKQFHFSYSMGNIVLPGWSKLQAELVRIPL